MLTDPKGEGGDVEALLKNRVLNNNSVSRAAMYDHDDFLCVASSTKRFNLEPEDVRKVRPSPSPLLSHHPRGKR